MDSDYCQEEKIGRTLENKPNMVMGRVINGPSESSVGMCGTGPCRLCCITRIAGSDSLYPSCYRTGGTLASNGLSPYQSTGSDHSHDTGFKKLDSWSRGSDPFMLYGQMVILLDKKKYKCH